MIDSEVVLSKERIRLHPRVALILLVKSSSKKVWKWVLLSLLSLLLLLLALLLSLLLLLLALSLLWVLLILPRLLSLRLRWVVCWSARRIFWISHIFFHLAGLEFYFIIGLVILINHIKAIRSLKPFSIFIPGKNSFVVVLILFFLLKSTNINNFLRFSYHNFVSLLTRHHLLDQSTDLLTVAIFASRHIAI